MRFSVHTAIASRRTWRGYDAATHWNDACALSEWDGADDAQEEGEEISSRQLTPPLKPSPRNAPPACAAY
jgi:hypothetical protein